MQKHPDRGAIVLSDEWLVAEGEWEERPIHLRVRDGVEPLAGHPEFGHQLVVKWEYTDDGAEGFPDDETTELLEAFEDRMLATLEEGVHAINVAVVTRAGVREWILYSSDLGESETRINQEFADDDFEYPLSLDAIEDPDWEEYRGIISNASDEDDDAASDDGAGDDEASEQE